MPSKDRINPKLNEWLDQEKPGATISAEHGATASRTGKRVMSGQVQRLARRLEVDPDALARKIPADTLRRTKYPVLETVDENGKRSFKHDVGISEDPLPLVRR